MSQHLSCHHKVYRMTCEEFDVLAARAAGRCEICGTGGAETGHGLLHIDHDARAGIWAVRGLLCSPCNSRLGEGVPWNAASERYLANPLRSPLDADRWEGEPDPEQMAKLAAAAARYREFLSAREELGDAIRAAAADDVRQVDILRAIDHVWTREKVRQECRKSETEA